MKILCVHRDLPPDSYTGVSIQVHRLANALFELGHDITVLTLSKTPPDARYKVITAGSKFKKPPFSLLFKPFKRLIVPWIFSKYPMKQFDIVHIHGDGVFIKSKPNFIRTFYGTAAMERRFANSWKSRIAQSISYLFEKIEDKRYRSMGTAVSISAQAKEYLPSIREVIPCMLPSVPKSNPKTGKAAPEILFMGSCGSRKQGEMALSLFAKIVKQVPDLKMAYVGSSAKQDQMYFKRKYGGQAPQPEFYQNISPDELNNLFVRSDIFLSLSSYEGFGVPLIEAMSFGCLVICFKTPGSTEIIKNNVTGIFTEAANLYDDIVRVLSNAEQKTEIALNGFQRAFEYSPEKIAKRYQDSYFKIRSAPGSSG